MLYINIISLAFLAAVIIFMVRLGGSQGLRRDAGWNIIHAGVITMLLVNILDFTRHLSALKPGFPMLSEGISDIIITAGYVGGFILVIVGGAQWLPVLIERQKEMAVHAISQKIALTEDKYRKLFQESYNAIFIHDFSGQIFDANHGAEQLTGYSMAELLGMTIQQLHPDPEAKAVEKDLRRANTRNKILVETRFKRKSGEIIDVEISGIVIGGDAAKGLVQGVVRDITAQKASRLALKASHSQLEHEVVVRSAQLAEEQERLATTLRAISDSVFSLGLDGRILYMNRAAADLTGWDVTDALGRPIGEVVSLLEDKGEEPFPFSMGEALRQAAEATPVPISSLLMGKGGEQRHIRYIVTPIRDAHRSVNGVVLVIGDTTELERAESERLRTQKLESLGILAGGLAHDFNNFLMGIMLNIANARLLAHDEQIIGHLSLAETSVEKAKGITQQLLTFAEGGAPIKSSTPISPLIKENVNFALHGTDILSEFSVESQMGAVYIDSGQITQVINNLVINAVHAMPKGGTLFVRAKTLEFTAPPIPADLAPGKYAAISIEDQGEGIDPDDIEYIFDPYFTTRSSGSGLGLASCYSILRQHKGGITVQSAKDAGSTFTFYLPIVDGSDESVHAANDGIHTGAGKILVVDDDEMIRVSLQTLLEIMGYTVETVANGDEAENVFTRAHCAEKPFDLAILDLTIPGGRGGVETFEALRKIDSAIIGIVTSGYATNPVMANHADFGFKGVLPKPFRPEDLSAVLKNVTADGKMQK
ncbi:MAG: PAS domain S-box protein [Candidatus Marinimicrobia bacterium]|nr:PAS domain S-box protein [Candidatus Neomarinimicrobiota bacterium]